MLGPDWSQDRTNRLSDLDKASCFAIILNSPWPNDRYVGTNTTKISCLPSDSPCWRVLGTKGSCYAHVFAMPIPWTKKISGQVFSLGFSFRKSAFVGGGSPKIETASKKLLFLWSRRVVLLGLIPLWHFPLKVPTSSFSQRSVMPLPRPLRPLATIAQKSPHSRFSLPPVTRLGGNLMTGEGKIRSNCFCWLQPPGKKMNSTSIKKYQVAGITVER